MGFELGLLTKCEPDQNKYVVNGKHDAEALATCLDKFIEKYVLCKQCRNPETDLSVKGIQKSLYLLPSHQWSTLFLSVLPSAIKLSIDFC